MLRKPTIVDLDKRVSALEKHVSTIQADIVSIKDNTELVVDGLTATKTVGGFLHKHGPRLIAFATGIMATLGIGNPNMWKFISSFVW